MNVTKLALQLSLEVINARKKKGLTQEAAAHLLHVSRGCLQMIENAKHLPSYPVAIKLKRYLGIDLDLFYSIVEQDDLTRDAARSSKEATIYVPVSSL